jgi:hypothetical protein
MIAFSCSHCGMKLKVQVMDDNYISRLTTIEFPGLEPAAAPVNDN